MASYIQGKKGCFGTKKISLTISLALPHHLHSVLVPVTDRQQGGTLAHSPFLFIFGPKSYSLQDLLHLH